jgi:hypothetical protein
LKGRVRHRNPSKTFFQFKDHKWSSSSEHAHALRAARISTARNDEIEEHESNSSPPSGEGGGGGDGEDKKKDALCAWSPKDANQKDKIMKERAELYHKHSSRTSTRRRNFIGSTHLQPRAHHP